jgi:hypothetical protein
MDWSRGGESSVYFAYGPGRLGARLEADRGHDRDVPPPVKVGAGIDGQV